jgi:hypothetical protein
MENEPDAFPLCIPDFSGVQITGHHRLVVVVGVFAAVGAFLAVRLP